jgi:hypothetical protein
MVYVVSPTKFWVKPELVVGAMGEKEDKRKITRLKILQKVIYIVCLFVLVLLLLIQVTNYM